MEKGNSANSFPQLYLQLSQNGNDLFDQSIVLLMEKSSAGIQGLILNKATDIKFKTALDMIDGSLPNRINLSKFDPDEKILLGGPLQHDFLWILHDSAVIYSASKLLTEDIYFCALGNFLEERHEIGTAKILLMGVGLSSWGRGQFEREQTETDWWRINCKLSEIIATPVKERFEKGLNSLNIASANYFDLDSRVIN